VELLATKLIFLPADPISCFIVSIAMATHQHSTSKSLLNGKEIDKADVLLKAINSDFAKESLTGPMGSGYIMSLSANLMYFMVLY
jgi:hypothetical protein